jgi:hypothetical protein
VLLAAAAPASRASTRPSSATCTSSSGGGKVIRIEEPIYGGANGALKIAHDMPAEYWEKLK